MRKVQGRLAGALAGWLLLATAGWAAPRILPSGPDVPANLLRIEIDLDRPLLRPLDMSRVALFDERGRSIRVGLLDLPLASRDGRKVTLLMDPGRLKTGVGPNVVLGLALHQGEWVTLSVSDPQLGTPLRKRWRVVPARRERIVPQLWNLQLPVAGGRDPLDVSFSYALGSSAAELIAIAAPNGERVVGAAMLTRGETHWRFVPARPWESGQYELRVHPSLEDVAGNRVCAAFEARKQFDEACTREARVAFRARPRAGDFIDPGPDNPGRVEGVF